ncbi:zinc finger CCCH domain-containing protein 3 [Bradysia coprophila]|uniref:zinc finger CCCH domain-containing protein 3 n=1 Tax=Bradysia coprophila TaxID=38358 RepID=UPI00187DBFDD|nr:zinc finger CCCH domain-containing protein 3 [Bradysia coprophila]
MDQSKQIKNSSTIFINPKFKAHINPNFLNSLKPTTTSNNIFINPKFISNLSSNNNPIEQPSDKVASPQAKIIRQTSRNLVRQPILPATNVSTSVGPTNLIKIGKRKLVRPNQGSSIQSNQDVRVHDSSAGDAANIRTKYKIINKSLNIYKIDRTRTRPAKERTAKRIKYFNECITPTKVIVTDYKLCRIGNPAVSSKPGEYNLLNINGVLYKSSSTKLRKQPSTSMDNKSRQLTRQSSSTNSCSLYVRGEKFLLDPSGKKLVRVSTNQNAITKKRIYLGGLTYIAKANNTYEPTNSHNTRLHLNVAKQKSINLLSKNLVKSNVTCQIYRKLGKCLALQRGRCSKVHDRNQVAICQKFLKGACTNENCLLSHDTSLSKMPTCKFFLLGECAKSDCPYLHKKVNDKTAICHDFLRGYCPKADKCNLRHEFLCPNFESKNGCTVARCPYVHRNKISKPVAVRQRTAPTSYVTEPSRSVASSSSSSSSSASTSTSAESNIRYFINKNRRPNDNPKSKNGTTTPGSTDSIEKSQEMDSVDDCLTNDDSKSFAKRKKLGTLPSFIPIN